MKQTIIQQTTYIRMKSILITGGIAFSLLFSGGCGKHLDSLNKDPNTPQSVENPQLLIPGIVKNAVRNYSYTAEFTGSVAGDYYANQYTSGFDDAWTPGQVEGGFLWNFYEQLRDAENLRILSHSKGFSNNEGVALVLKPWLFQVLTDNFGDIPFSEALAGKTSGNFAPKFDSQETVYYGILDLLKTANTLLTTGKDPINSDILMGGTPLRWREFANGLSLRLLMRMSGKTGLKIDVAAEMNKIASNATTYPLFTSYADQAALNFLNELNNEFPAYHNNPIGDYHLSTTFETNLKNFNDPRIAYYATRTPASIASGVPAFGGVPNCIGTSESSYNGGTSNQSQVAPVLQPLANSAGLPASPTAAQGLILTYAEVQFILAEAKERGLISVGIADSFYYRGIRDQFAYLQSRLAVAGFAYPTPADIAPPASYFQQPGVLYTGTTDLKLYKIRLQKWFALFYNGFEGWYEWRRTGVPKEIKTGPNSAIAEWPRRTRYPLSEQTINSTNYNKAVQAMGADDLVTHVWWNK
jgi:hypothetical protein